MRRVVVFLFIQLALVAQAGSASYEVDADNMRTIEDSMKNLDSHVALKDAKGATQEAKDLIAAFEQVQDFYARKGNATDAVGFARKTHELVRQILSSVEAGDYDGAAGSVNQLARSCKSCHDIYK